MTSHSKNFLSRPSANRRFEETVVFVHHFGGTRLSSKRHQDFVNELGFDCVAFDLPYQNPKRFPKSKQTLRDLARGFRHAWADQIEEVLDSIEGPKILFSFSMPGGATLEAISRRQSRDISSWVCEGGPFLSVAQCYWNYMNRFYPSLWLPLKASAVAACFLSMGIYNYKRDVKRYFQELPSGFPALSIRAWQDKLVPISAIDSFFSHQNHLELEILSVPEADHLEGLREYPEDYKPRLSKFLQRTSREASIEPSVATT